MATPTLAKTPTMENSASTISESRKLSEVAKRIAIPKGIEYTHWNVVRDTCRYDLGIEFDGWQDGLGQLLLAKRANGMLAHTVGGFGLSVCRQAGKTYFIAGALFGLCVRYKDLLAIWSAHHSDTASETFLAMQAFAAREAIAPHIRKVYTGSGDEEVRFVNGSRIKFGARERGFGRGVPGVDIIVNDEGQILSDRAMNAMLATMNTSRFGLHIYAGTPPDEDTRASGKSETWFRMRDEAWMIKDPNVKRVETEDTVWVEMGADQGADLDDREQWAKANPSYPHRTPIQAFMRLRKKLKDDAFRREGLGIYDEEEASVFDLTKWNALVDPDVDMPEHAALVLDVSPDRRWSSIAIAGEIDDGRVLVMVNSVRGTQNVVAKIAELRDERNIIDISITGGAARALETDLVDAAIDYETLPAHAMSAAYANLQEKIKADPPAIVHVGQPELTFALANAKSRYLQTGEAEAFDRREYSIDVSPAVSVAGALYRWGLQAHPMPLIF